MTLLLGLLANPTVLAVLGGIGAVIFAFLRGKSSGAAKERQKQAQGRLDAIKDKKEIDDEVEGLAPADLDARFRRWLRD